jgi:hypothetical protein
LSISDRRRRLAAIVFSLVLVTVAAGLATHQGEGGGAGATEAAPRFVDAADLVTLEEALGHEVYWAGERPPAQLELTEEVDRSVYLRYLPPGVDAGDPRPRFLTVGTYPVVNAAASLRRTAADEGGTLGRTARGGVVLLSPSSGGNVYIAYPGSDLQIEVYDPAPGRARWLIRSGGIRPVG